MTISKPSNVSANNQLSIYAKSTSDKKKLDSDMAMFLKMLTTQLKHQDPTKPLDTNQMAMQLAAFSSVEQQIATNTHLTTLLQQSQTAAIGYMDRLIEFPGPRLPLQNGIANFAYGLKTKPEKLIISIIDGTGQAVRSFTDTPKTTGMHEIQWNGLNDQGEQLEDGTYTISVMASDSAGKPLDSWTTSFGKITGITYEKGKAILIAGKTGFSIDDVLSVNAQSSKNTKDPQ